MEWHPLPLADESEVSRAFSGSLSHLTEHFAAVNVSKISPTASGTDAAGRDGVERMINVAKQSYMSPSVGDCSSTPHKSSSSLSSLPSSRAVSAKEADSSSNATSDQRSRSQRSNTPSPSSDASRSGTSLFSSKADLGAVGSSQELSDGHHHPPPDLSVGDITGSTTPGLGADKSHRTEDSTPDLALLHGFVPTTHQVTSSHLSSRQWLQHKRQVGVSGAHYHRGREQRQTLQTDGGVSWEKEEQVAFSERVLSKNHRSAPQPFTAQSVPGRHPGTGPRQHGLHNSIPMLPSLSDLRKGPQFVQFSLPKETASEHSTSTSGLSSTLQTGINSSTITHNFPSHRDTTVSTHTPPSTRDSTVGTQTLHSTGDPSTNTSTSIPSQEETSESTHEVAATMEAGEVLSTNTSTSTLTLSKEATSEESTNEVIETLATEAVRKARGKPTQFLPGRDLAHLDKLWEALLRSPYATARALQQCASRGDGDGDIRRPHQQDSESVLQVLRDVDVGESALRPELCRIKCTCGAHESQRAAERQHPATHSSGYGAKSTGALKMQTRPAHPLEKDDSSPSLRQAPPPKANAQHAAPRHEAVRKKAKNRGVQTSPRLFQHGVPQQENNLQTPNRWTQLPEASTRTEPDSKAVSFTVSHSSPLGHESSSSTLALSHSPYQYLGNKGRHSADHSLSASSFESSPADLARPQIPTLAPLSLQEACQTYKKAFIRHCQQRQLFLQIARRQRDELDQISSDVHRGGPVRREEGSVPHPTAPPTSTVTEKTRVLAPSRVPVPKKKLRKQLLSEMKAKARRYESTLRGGVGMAYVGV